MQQRKAIANAIQTTPLNATTGHSQTQTGKRDPGHNTLQHFRCEASKSGTVG